MKKTLYLIAPFALICLTMLVKPELRFNWPQSAIEAGFIGWIHLLLVAVFAGVILWNIYSGIRNSR